MADKQVRVRIKKRPDDPSQCDVEPQHFVVEKDGEVNFVFVDEESNPRILFEAESPFDGDAGPGKRFKPGKKKVKTEPLFEFKYKYRISWDGGQGNGSGEIVP